MADTQNDDPVSEKRCALFFENMLEGFAYCRMLYGDAGQPDDFIYVTVNPAFERLTGLTDVVGKRATEAIPGIGEATPELFEIYGRVVETGEPAELELDFTPLGRWLHLTVFRPEPGHFGAVFANVTEPRRLQRELDSERLRFKSLVENSAEAILLTLPDGSILAANREACRILGRSVEEMCAAGMAGLVDATDSRPAPGLEERAEKGRASGELRLVRGDGTTFPAAVTSCVYTDFDGVERASVSIRDLSERDATQQALRQSEELYRSILRASPDDITFTDLEGRIRVVSPAAVSMLGYEHADEMVGRLMIEFLAPGDRERAAANVELMSQGVYTGPGEYVAIRADGSAFPMEANGEFVRDADGRPTGMVFVVRDVTQRKRSEDEIRRLNVELAERVVTRTAQLETTNKELEAFAYSVAHDLRAPLRVIDGFSALIAEDAADRLTDAEVDHLQRVRRAAQRMAALLDDLLGLSRTARRDVRREDVDLSALASSVLDELREAHPGRSVEIAVAPAMTARADPELTRVILASLLSNAWKFTGRCDVARIEVGARDQDGARAFFVRDNGVGFDMAYAQHLFGVFQRMHGADEFEGNGIGLATVQRLVTLHGGRVWAEAEVDKGATLFFTLPAPTSAG